MKRVEQFVWQFERDDIGRVASEDLFARGDVAETAVAPARDDVRMIRADGGIEDGGAYCGLDMFLAIARNYSTTRL
jgi:hypothetical protein